MIVAEKIDRLSIRERPAGWPIMRQNWGKLLFMHWPVPAEALRPLLPERLSLDTFEGQAWIGVVPFTMWGVRPVCVPSLPYFSAFHELNVRTYVHLDGVPGVWFLSLDAANVAAVRAARALVHLPYFDARIELRQRGDEIDYVLQRTHRSAPPAEFSATWRIGDPLPEAEPETLTFFLTERYCLYAARREKLYRMRIFHSPWPLRRASLLSYRSTMIESHGLPAPATEPALHYAEAIAVDIWPLRRMRKG